MTTLRNFAPVKVYRYTVTEIRLSVSYNNIILILILINIMYVCPASVTNFQILLEAGGWNDYVRLCLVCLFLLC